MIQQTQPPDIEKVKQRAAKMEELCKRWDALILVTDYMIEELEEQIRQQPLYQYRLRKAQELLNLEEEKPAAFDSLSHHQLQHPSAD